MAHEFIQMDIARGTANEIKQATRPPLDDGDDWKANKQGDCRPVAQRGYRRLLGARSKL